MTQKLSYFETICQFNCVLTYFRVEMDPLQATTTVINNKKWEKKKVVYFFYQYCF